MPLPKENTYTTDYIYSLPEGQRAELIDGVIYDMAPPTDCIRNLFLNFTTRSLTISRKIREFARFFLLHLLFFLIRIIIIMLSRISP